eukprot:6262966-Amphidinium_carterae.1
MGRRLDGLRALWGLGRNTTRYNASNPLRQGLLRRWKSRVDHPSGPWAQILDSCIACTRSVNWSGGRAFSSHSLP